MRIIGGKYKGKKLKFINSSITRPLRDLVKENIFNIINHSKLLDIDIKNSNVLDLYSGTGSFGIECISRGAKKIFFIENYFEALKILNKNILARISIQGSVYSILSDSSLVLKAIPREYFGPIDIQKLQIQLLDEYGRVLDLNNMDFSFALKMECMYNN